MTEKDLQSIKFLKLEIKRNDKLLQEVSRAGGSGKTYAELLARTREELLRNKVEIETLIHSIDDAEIRLILKYKFIDLKSWNFIARQMHYDRSTIYKKYKKFIKGEQEQ